MNIAVNDNFLKLFMSITNWFLKLLFCIVRMIERILFLSVEFTFYIIIFIGMELLIICKEVFIILC